MLHFRIVDQEKLFELFDGEGGQRYFGANYRYTAEWVLLNILFPLNYV